MAGSEAKERKILAAIDGGEESTNALSWCLKNIVAENSKDTLILLYSKQPLRFYPATDGPGYPFSTDLAASVERYNTELAESVMEKAKGLCKEVPDVKVETRVERGDPRDVICQMTEKLGADMLVMGTHGYGMIKRDLEFKAQTNCQHSIEKFCLDNIQKSPWHPKPFMALEFMECQVLL